MNCDTCSGGYYRVSEGSVLCPDHQTDRCRRLTDAQRDQYRVDYLAACGFRKRYQRPDPKRLFGGNAPEVAESIRAYGDNISERIRAGSGFILSGTVGQERPSPWP